MRASVTPEAISAETAVPGKFNLTAQVPDERSDELPCKTLYITEIASTFQELYGTEEEIDQVPQDCDIVFTDYQSRMTSVGERHFEACRPTESLLRPKDLVNIGN